MSAKAWNGHRVVFLKEEVQHWGTGHNGSYIAELLLEKGNTVQIIKRRASSSNSRPSIRGE